MSNRLVHRTAFAIAVLAELLLGAQSSAVAGDLQHSQPAAAANDPKRGELLFQTCTACHNILGDGIGPDLTGIFGQKAAMRPDFTYSPALKASGIVWDEANLRAFIQNPQAHVKGTTMLFPGYATQADIDAVIAYLKTLK